MNNNIEKMKNKPLIISIILTIMASSCHPFVNNGHFHIEMRLANATQNEIFVEQSTESTQEQYYVVVVTTENSSNNPTCICLEEYFGRSIGDTPTDNEVLDALQKIKLYRFKDGEKQYVRQEILEELSFFTRIDDGYKLFKEKDLIVHVIAYQMIVTDNMFEQ